jgi:hypothetical protein
VAPPERNNKVQGHVALIDVGNIERVGPPLRLWDLQLCCDKIEGWGDAENASYFLQFRLEPHGGIRESAKSKPVEELVQELSTAWITLMFLPEGTEVTKGFIIILNSILEKTFPIRPQKVDQGLATYVP